MLLSYLYDNFIEEAEFARDCGLSPEALDAMGKARVMPSASYVYKTAGQSASFVSEYTEEATYRFHLKGHKQWMTALARFGICSEDRARRYFFHRYDGAKEMFLTGQPGAALVDAAPDVAQQFDAAYAEQTWENFLAGVYGVCTTDGQPETVFLKQAGVLFIEALSAQGPAHLTGDRLALLGTCVDFLDQVEAAFAPHEVAQTSRQRCITDIRAQYFHAV
ncbi:DUF6058 family natural product biosynthesis protein [uncultured Sulfitobacter sp.]|uniref:DUF6058 family natural product biosynthesis protein n=1 Tax=uncultured Sulfitobacter sp. TaxID=191468 RepID=UPI0026197B5E|nr:DUF6058 family natural product biosynthesis protein [uncultured Sulfitobacter sp.]